MFNINVEILKTKHGYLEPCTFMHAFLVVQIKTTNMETFYHGMLYYRIKSSLWYTR